MSETAYPIEDIVEILLEADEIGDSATAEKWSLTTRTIRKYRHRMKNEPEFAGMYVDAKRQLFASVVSRMSRAQKRILERLELLVATTDDVSKVAQAYKIVSDAFLAQSIMSGVSEPKSDLNGIKRDKQGAGAESLKREIREALESSGAAIGRAPKSTQ